MSTTPTSETYTNIVHETDVDGGWSGQLRIVVGTNNDSQTEPLVFVDSDLLGPRRLVLTAEQAVELATQLAAGAGEVLPPAIWDFKAFESTFGYPAPTEHSRTVGDLKRHTRALSDQHEAEKKRLSAGSASL